MEIVWCENNESTYFFRLIKSVGPFNILYFFDDVISIGTYPPISAYNPNNHPTVLYNNIEVLKKLQDVNLSRPCIPSNIKMTLPTAKMFLFAQ